MMKVNEILEWMKALPEDSEVWIDDGGLTLEASNGAYIEIGGEPDEE